MYVMTTANTNLKCHIKNHHSDIWNDNAVKYGWKNLDSQASTKSIASHGTPHEEFDIEKFHQRLVNFIIADNQVRPFCAPNGISFSLLITSGHQHDWMPRVQEPPLAPVERSTRLYDPSSNQSMSNDPGGQGSLLWSPKVWPCCESQFLISFPLLISLSRTL